MQVTEIIVSAGRKFNHPYEDYSNLSPGITLKAKLVDGEDWEVAAKALQAEAERAIEDHKRVLLESIEKIEQMTRHQQRVADLAKKIREANEELDNVRREHPDLPSVAALPHESQSQSQATPESEDPDAGAEDGDSDE